MTPLVRRLLLLLAAVTLLSSPSYGATDDDASKNQLRRRRQMIETNETSTEIPPPEATAPPETALPETAPPTPAPTEAATVEETLQPSFVSSNSTRKSFNASSIHVNATALSLGACEKIDLSIAYLTSLDLDSSFTNYSFLTSNSQKESAYIDVYILQLIITPISFGLLFFGSFLILPTCILAATGIGIFAVFHVLDNLWLARAANISGTGLDCPMKLALSCISAFLAAMMATTFVRFGLFSLGALAAGVVSYLLFDAFPMLDLGAISEVDSDLSSFAWIVTILMGCLGGVLLRWYEEASLELVTATLGGIGCAYSIHTVVIIQGNSQLDRSVVFLLAVGLATIGCRFQRRRRFNRYAAYHQLKKEEEEVPAPPPHYAMPAPAAPPPPLYAMPPAAPPQQPAMIPMEMIQPQIHQAGPTWSQVQHSINHAVKGLADSQANDNNGPSSEQIKELTQSLNSLLARMPSPGTLLKNATADEEDDKAD